MGGIVLALAVPPQGLGDGLGVAGALEHPQVHPVGERDRQAFLHERDPVRARDEVRHGQVTLHPYRDARTDVEQSLISSSSPKCRRSRDSAALAAGWVTPSRSAARVTLRSRTSSRSATSRFRSRLAR